MSLYPKPSMAPTKLESKSQGAYWPTKLCTNETPITSLNPSLMLFTLLIWLKPHGSPLCFSKKPCMFLPQTLHLLFPQISAWLVLLFPLSLLKCQR